MICSVLYFDRKGIFHIKGYLVIYLKDPVVIFKMAHISSWEVKALKQIMHNIFFYLSVYLCYENIYHDWFKCSVEIKLKIWYYWTRKDSQFIPHLWNPNKIKWFLHEVRIDNVKISLTFFFYIYNIFLINLLQIISQSNVKQFILHLLIWHYRLYIIHCYSFSYGLIFFCDITY